VVQLSCGDGSADVVQILKGGPRPENLIRLLADPAVLKLFHFARFDIAVLSNAFGVVTGPVYCTKIASKLVRTYTDRHGLKDLVRELLGIDLSKQQQSSDWAADSLSEAQLAYAASDVLHLHALHARLEAMLAREERAHLAKACFDFLPFRAELDLAGWPESDIFAHA
jgi:ribonuclease D